MASQLPPVLVSSCLLGTQCRFDGSAAYFPAMPALLSSCIPISVCPELLAGQRVPRDPVEQVENRAMTIKGVDETDYFRAGAEHTLRIARQFGAKHALLKSGSPSCGCDFVYDGTFSDHLVRGMGFTAQLLSDNGIRVFSENDFEGLLEAFGETQTCKEEEVLMRHQAQHFEDVTIVNAQSGDLEYVIGLIKSHNKFALLKSEGAICSEEGFLLTELSEDECLKLIEGGCVSVAVTGKEVVGVLISMEIGSNPYKGLPNPSITWENANAERSFCGRTFAYLWIISVKRNFMRKGIGRSLISCFMVKAREAGVSAIFTDFMVRPILNQGSNNFFNSLGFRPAGVLNISDYYGVGDSSYRILFHEV